MLRDKDLRRFWSKVSLPDDNGCMLWLKSLNSCGYGTFGFNGKSINAHRLSLIIAVGEPPKIKMDAAHSCKNKHCIAPDHLSWKTRADNQDDRRRDGTMPSGERNGAAKLSMTQVKEIRRRYLNGEGTYKALASEYQVHYSMIGNIVNNKNWVESEE
jgi:hypothetical protein